MIKKLFKILYGLDLMAKQYEKLIFLKTEFKVIFNVSFFDKNYKPIIDWNILKPFKFNKFVN